MTLSRLSRGRVFHMSELATVEINRLERLEETISKGLRSFIAVGTALAEIREQRLWRFQYGSFDEYCQERWNFSASRGRQLVAAVEAVSSLPEGMPKPHNAAQASELSKVDDDIRADVWTMAIQTANERGDHSPTTAEVRDAARALTADADRSKGAADMERIAPMFRELSDCLRKASGLVDELHKTSAKQWILMAGNLAHDIRAAREATAMAKPVSECHQCEGKGCRTCMQTGWVAAPRAVKKPSR